jgi:mono/diheme cytochrome c family protein
MIAPASRAGYDEQNLTQWPALVRRANVRSSIVSLAIAGVLMVAISSAAAWADGAQLYQQHCAACHQPKGQGVPGLYPPLTGRLAALAAAGDGRAFLAQVLLYGMSGKITVGDRSYAGVMPGVPKLPSSDIAAILNHVISGFGGTMPAGVSPITPQEVEAQRSIRLTPRELNERRRLVVEKLKLSETRVPAGAASVMPVFSAAAENYIRWCQGCHLASGRGAPPAVPDLVDKVGYFARLPEGRAYLIRVPGAALAPISDADLAAVLNFLLQTFSPKQLPPDFRPFTADEVATLRPQRMVAVKREREALVAKLRDAGVMP